MIQVRVKATNLSTSEIVYEGVKKTYASYDDAWSDMHKAVHYRYNTLSSYKLPCELKWKLGEHCYICTKHGNIRLTHYIVYDTEKHYCQDGNGYFYILPYEDNEHLVGTTDNPSNK